MRSLFLIFSRPAILGFLFLLELLCPVQAGDYRVAERTFLRLPIDQRYEIQMLLGVAGYWPAVANDQFSHRLFDAIGRFQEANGFPVSGILNDPQIDRLHQIADPILAYWQLRMVRHPAVGLPLWIPFGVGFNQIATTSGLNFENPNKIASLSFNFFPSGNLRSTYTRLTNFAEFRPVYNKIKGNFFAVQAEGSGLTAYSRYQRVSHGIIGFTLTWPNDDAHNAVLHGERLAALMSDLFRANVELGLPRSPPMPRPATVAVAPPPQPATPPQVVPAPQFTPRPPMPALPAGKEPGNQKSFGTGFFVSSEGHIITDSHVIKDCSSVQVTVGLAPKMAGRILTQDFANDLALLKVETHPASFASLRPGVRLGEGVAAFGFPLTGLLATGGNFTLGNVTAVAGLGDDTRFLQISAPVQPGNSGGPLLDYSGNVVGVVEAKLDAMTVAAITHDLPQNVNFAIKANVVTNFLDANNVACTSGSLSESLPPADIAERAKSFSVAIECSNVRSEEPPVKILATLTGQCRFEIVAGFFPCDPKVTYVQRSNHRIELLFMKDRTMFSLSGGKDRQPNLENYYLAIDTFKIKNDNGNEAVDHGMEGECHFLMNEKDPIEVKCDIYNRAKGSMYKFYLENIEKVDRQTF